MKIGKMILGGIVCLSLLVTPALPASAAGSYTFRHTEQIGYRVVPVGTRLRFQTAPLKKGEALCYTAGNRKTLKTFVSGKPVQNADGTVSYNLGFTCAAPGETGLYIHKNGKPFQIGTVKVVNDTSKTGFPLSTSFGKIFAGRKVEKIIIRYGTNGRSKQASDTATISRLMAKLAPERLYRDCDTRLRSGWSYGIDFYLKGQKGCYRYTLGYDFRKQGGFSAPLPTGNCVEESYDEVFAAIAECYRGLK